MIPKNIIQFWHNSNKIPAPIAQAMSVTKENHPDFIIIQADDTYMHQFIAKKYNKAILKLYLFNTIPASRSDIARLMLLYEFGGVYIDASMMCNHTFSQYVDNNDIILVQRDDAVQHLAHPEKAHVINGIIAAPRHSKFIKWCIEKVFRYLLTGEYNKLVNRATGPDVINQAIKHFECSMSIKKISFSQMKNSFLSFRTVPNVSNSWVQQQEKGIFPLSFYTEHTKKNEKILIIGNYTLYFSFSLLSAKNNKGIFSRIKKRLVSLNKKQ